MPRLRRVRWRVLACPVGWPFGKGDLEVIVVGIDPHKKTHTAAAAASTGEPVAEVTVKARLKGHERLLAWARELDDKRVFAIEDCRHVSGNLERFLIARGEKVVRVPPKLMAGARRSARTAGKSDGVDALAVAHAFLREPDLPQAHLAGIERDIKQLLDHREDQVWERTRIQGRLRWHLHDIDPSSRSPSGRSIGSAGSIASRSDSPKLRGRRACGSPWSWPRTADVSPAGSTTWSKRSLRSSTTTFPTSSPCPGVEL